MSKFRGSWLALLILLSACAGGTRGTGSRRPILTTLQKSWELSQEDESLVNEGRHEWSRIRCDISSRDGGRSIEVRTDRGAARANGTEDASCTFEVSGNASFVEAVGLPPSTDVVIQEVICTDGIVHKERALKLRRDGRLLIPGRAFTAGRSLQVIVEEDGQRFTLKFYLAGDPRCAEHRQHQ